MCPVPEMSPEQQAWLEGAAWAAERLIDEELANTLRLFLQEAALSNPHRKCSDASV